MRLRHRRVFAPINGYEARSAHMRPLPPNHGRSGVGLSAQGARHLRRRGAPNGRESAARLFLRRRQLEEAKSQVHQPQRQAEIVSL
jgi:hypothetical protein